MRPDLNLIPLASAARTSLAVRLRRMQGLPRAASVVAALLRAEMRGGTANCSVCISDRAIGSPLVLNPNALIVMNLPSFDKFIDTVKPGGTVVVDSSMVSKKVERSDINVFYVPATKLAEESGLKGLGNIILLGKLFKELKFCSFDALNTGLVKSVPASKPQMLEFNRRAIQLGMDS